MKLNPKENPICEYYILRNQTFTEKAKSYDLINKYDWSIFFDSKEYQKEDTAFLLMGSLPEEIDSDLGYYKKGYFNRSNIRNVYMENYDMKFKVNKSLVIMEKIRVI